MNQIDAMTYLKEASALLGLLLIVYLWSLVAMALCRPTQPSLDGRPHTAPSMCRQLHTMEPSADLDGQRSG